MRKIIKILIAIIAVVSVLNYIPVQFAVKNDENNPDMLYCQTEPKLSSEHKWVATAVENQLLDSDIVFSVNGDDPDKVLNSDSFDVDTWHHVTPYAFEASSYYGLNNKFIIYYDNTIDNIRKTEAVSATDWDIIYPIRRAGWRRFITPKSYLTVYDFNLKDIADVISHLKK